MLVNQNNANVLPLGCEAVKGRLDSSVIRLVVHHKKVLLRIWGSRNVLRFECVLELRYRISSEDHTGTYANACKEESRDGVLDNC